jgi:hypothetical protein
MRESSQKNVSKIWRLMCIQVQNDWIPDKIAAQSFRDDDVVVRFRKLSGMTTPWDDNLSEESDPFFTIVNQLIVKKSTLLRFP